MRGLLVALMIATPALMLPGVSADTTQIILLVALLASFLVFIEYNSNFPSIIEFRNAPPLSQVPAFTIGHAQRGHGVVRSDVLGPHQPGQL